MPLDSPMHKACGKGAISEVATIITQAADAPAKNALVNAIGAADRTPLHRAAGGNYAMIVQLLLDNGATVDATDKAGRTPLLWACIGGHEAPCQKLLEQGANPNAATKSGMSAMHAAVTGGHLNCVKLLIWFGQEKGNEVDFAVQSDGKTALELAKEKKHEKVANVIAFKLKHGTVKQEDLDDAEAGSAACVVS